MRRNGQCQCGKLRVFVEGEPVRVGVCHCTDCQRRTGSMHSFNAYFRQEQVEVTGASKSFQRDGQDGRKLTNYFCPDCGSTAFWVADAFPGLYGMAVGIFADPDFPAPHSSSWESSRHRWVVLPDTVARFPKNRPFS
jgi:hypothetical protein